MKRTWQLLATIVLGTTASHAHHLPPADPGRFADGEPNQDYDQREEAFIRTPPGFSTAGQRKQAPASDSATLQVRIVDQATGELAACRVNIVGPDGNYYEPQQHPLQPFNAHNVGCQRYGETHAPSRYYGWFFYTLGEFRVDVPAGDVRIEVWKGYEYQPVQKTLRIQASAQPSILLELQRTVPMHEFGYYSGDTHIHLNRQTAADEERALDLMAAEDIRYGFLLCMNDPGSYSGRMDRQEWPQERGFGPASVVTRGQYGIASAQEYRTKAYGHICLLMHESLVLEGVTVRPNQWPPFGVIGQMTRRLGGYSFHAHGGYSLEIYADYVQHMTDGVELLQMAHYRGIGLAGWYRILNIGYRFAALAGSDFPYTRALGDCRTYVHCDAQPSYSDWARMAAAGHSFFTTGPLVLLQVDGKRPGDIVRIGEDQPHRLNVKLRVRCEVTPVEHLDLIVNGKTRQRWTLPAGAASTGGWHERRLEIEVDEPSWIAARAYSISPTGRSDAEAHTNPVYVYCDDRRPFHAADRDWLVERLDAQIEALRERSFSDETQAEKEQALELFRESRRRLLEIR